MSEYVYFLKRANKDLMKVGRGENPLAEAKALSEEIDLKESKVIAFPDKEMAQAVIDELTHVLKPFEQGEGSGWYTTEAKEDLLEQAKQLGLKAEPLLG